MRITTAEQDIALAASNRTTQVRVKIEDADGTMQDVSDYFVEANITASSDLPISRGVFTFWRRHGGASLAPLIEASELNRNVDDTYAPLVNPFRFMTLEVATLLHSAAPAADEWVMLWEGYIDEMDWGGFRSRVTVFARDPLSRFNDTIIETKRTYGSDSAPVNIETVMQSILDDNFGAGEFTLAVPDSPRFGILSYPLANVSVLEAHKALTDLIGWNLHWRWNDVTSDLEPTLWEPDRATTTSLYTFGPDDYYDVRSVRLNATGIRNAGQVFYNDLDGNQLSVTEERQVSIDKYGRRFIKIDAQNTSIRGSVAANALLTALLDDLEEPSVLQQLTAAFFWPIQLGDLYTYTANGEHYDTDQTWAVFAYQHILRPSACRTVVSARGKPSGGVTRWQRRERRPDRDSPVLADTELTTAFNASKISLRDVSVALGGGSTATLGKVGGPGPTTAAQTTWVELSVDGETHWFPAWK